MSEAPVVLVDEHDRVAVVTLNRPRARNSLVWDTWTELEIVLDDVRDSRRVDCLVITGADGFFSAGGDLKSTPARGDGPLSAAARLDLAQRIILKARSTPIPLIAAVEGGAVGLGWSLVLACDLVVAADDAFFSAPFVQRGVVPDGGAAWFLTRRLGRTLASELLLTGRQVRVNEAAQLGLVNRITTGGRALAAARELAAELTAGARAAVELSKRLIDQAESCDLATYLAFELTTATIAQLGDAAREGRSGFS